MKVSQYSVCPLRWILVFALDLEHTADHDIRTGSPWPFSFTGGYSCSSIMLRKDRMEVSALMRGCLGAIISESFSLAAVLGVLLETK
ncbi:MULTISPECIES: hypothetical protein [unclassified Mesotoga]|uniref:hypothetical protein n=1 Tax=unclassified Mesotoga TaxID=1184398 RepID=UPI0011AF08FE|nr:MULTISPECIES: hypothetical protein [unclassified Mesotoga]